MVIHAKLYKVRVLRSGKAYLLSFATCISIYPDSSLECCSHCQEDPGPPCKLHISRHIVTDCLIMVAAPDTSDMVALCMHYEELTASNLCSEMTWMCKGLAGMARCAGLTIFVRILAMPLLWRIHCPTTAGMVTLPLNRG